ncbi:MAG: TraB/GumN family protein [Asticcacaulis sp.]
MHLPEFVRRPILAALTAALMSFVTVPAHAETPAVAKPNMWVIKDADSTVYLFGSVHLLKAEDKWLTPELEAIFESADSLYLEIENMEDQALATSLIMKHGVDPKSGFYDPYSAEQEAVIRESLTKYGINPDQIKPLKHWLVALMLSIKQLEANDFDPNIGVDKTFMTRAKAKGLPIKGLETMEAQFLSFAMAPTEVQAEYLWQTVAEEDYSQEVIAVLVNAWLQGDDAKLEEILITEMKEKTPDLYETLMINRNRNWIGEIKTILDGSGTQFIVVGAGHLTGPDSVQKMLEAEGIKVSAYKY